MTGHPGRTLVTLAALAASLLLPAAELRGTPGAKRKVVVPRTVADAPTPPAGVTVAGRQSAVLDTAAATNWELVVVVDPALSTLAGAERAAELIAERASRMTALGKVSVVVVDTLLDEILSATGDAAALVDAAASIPTAGAYGEVLAGRAAIADDADPLERLDAAREELQLIRWRREALTDWLLTSRSSAPRALFLLENGFDTDFREAYGLDTELATGTPSPALDDRLLATSLAAAGWVVFPLDLETVRGARPDQGHAALARETGGRVVTDARDLDQALDSLAAAISLTLDVETAPTGPRQLAIDHGGTLSPPSWIGGTFLPGRSAAWARRFLAEEANGGLSVEASLNYPEDDALGRGAVIIEVGADLDPPGSPPSSDWLMVALYLDQIGAPPLQLELQGGGRPLAGVDRWVAQTALRLPEDAGELVAVVIDGLTGRWGASRVEDEGTRLASSGPGLVVESFDRRPEEPAPAATRERTVITLVAPDGDRLRGKQRFRTLVAVEGIAKVVFSLDGEPVETDEDPPFGATIDLGSEVARHTISIDAFDRVGDRIGGDTVRLNEPAQSFDVAIGEVSVEGSPPRVSFSAEVSHPTDVAVERVEFYFNERLLGTAASPPWTISATVGGTGETDYVRAVAYFADGSSLEDVRLLSALGGNEQVEVNLVQVYVVATDKSGMPVTDLAQDEFEVRLRGETQAIERFAYADEVPLSLAVTIDTSGSMFALIPDTITAAARFLTQIVGEKDQALIAAFDEQARVISPMSPDLGRHLRSLGGINVGFGDLDRLTALYDAVVFSALELPDGQGRKAVVLLTDGDDTASRMSLGRAIDTAKQVGTPIYVVSLVGVHNPRAGKRPAPFIATLTAQTGGEVFMISAMNELDAAYGRIAGELRSQYLLAFPTDEQLSQSDIDSIRVRTTRPGLVLRTVVGGRSVE